MTAINLDSLMNITYGLYVISSKQENQLNGLIGNTVIQTSVEPPTIAVCLNQNHLTHEFIEQSEVFSISVLAKDSSLKFIGNFGFHSGRDRDKFATVDYKVGKTGAPLLVENTISYVEAEVIDQLDVKTHTIFVGKIVGADEINSGKVLTYDYYHQVKNGKTPASAPSYIQNSEDQIGQNEDKYQCEVCGYVYDPAQGDPEADIPSGTPFTDLPADWVCPLCGVGKDQFKPIVN